MSNLRLLSRLRVLTPSPSLSTLTRACHNRHQQPTSLKAYSKLYLPVRSHGFATAPTSILRAPLGPPLRSGLRVYSRLYDRRRQSHHNFTFNRNVTRVCLGAAILVYAAWDFADRGLVYTILEKTRGFLQSLGLPVPRELNTRILDGLLNKYFVFRSNDPQNLLSWIGSAFSHQGLMHIAFNLLVWSSFAPMLYSLPRIHYVTLLFGSAIASSGLWLLDRESIGKPATALGSSGIVEGVLMTVTMFAPTMRASIFGIIPVQLWMVTCGFLAFDYYIMVSGEPSRVGHSAHLGGAAFGLFYYTVFLRKYGGILGPRRF